MHAPPSAGAYQSRADVHQGGERMPRALRHAALVAKALAAQRLWDTSLSQHSGRVTTKTEQLFLSATEKAET